MPLPPSFSRDGFVTSDKIRTKRRLMIGTDGPSNSGKTEFALSAPGPGLVICLDRGFEAMLDNKTPPPTRRGDYGFKVVTAPLAGQATQAEYLDYFKRYRDMLIKAADNTDAKTVVDDGASDSWELQRLAAFGKLVQIPSILYTSVNAARRALLARLFDSGKNIIATHKVKRQYFPKLDRNGNPEMGGDGKPIREWDGKSFERQGFEDANYLWQVHLRHFYDEESKEFGITILDCKADKSLVGYELRGADCNFAGLVQTIYPETPLKEWGL